ncbi:MAG: site-specific integrase [Bacteroidota bacterium]|nr:site-specific integrase [Bacteroidota bacterium]
MKITHKFYQRADDSSMKTPHPIYLQITLDRKTTKRAIGYECKSTEWLPELGQAKHNHAINTRINTLKQRLTDLQYELEKKAKPLNLIQIADIVFEKGTQATFITVFFESYIDNASHVKRISFETAKHYKSCLKALKKYILETYKQPDLNINAVDYSFVEGFDRFLHKEALGLNTINGNYHKKLKTALIYAEKEGLITGNPYAKFKLKFTASHREFLTETELKMILDAKLYGNESLEKVRDIFLFSCYTGLRFSDAMDLTIPQIRTNTKNYFIYRGQIKTGESVNIPIPPEAVSIIDKYDNEERKATQKVLPKISNAKINVYLKTLADLAGIKKNLSHHIARHTFATFLLNKGVPIEIVSKLLGHTSLRTTQIYAKLQNKTVEDQVLKAFLKVD